MSNHCHFHRKRIAHSCGVQFILETPEEWAYSPKSEKCGKASDCVFPLACAAFMASCFVLVGRSRHCPSVDRPCLDRGRPRRLLHLALGCLVALGQATLLWNMPQRTHGRWRMVVIRSRPCSCPCRCRWCRSSPCCNLLRVVFGIWRNDFPTRICRRSSANGMNGCRCSVGCKGHTGNGVLRCTAGAGFARQVRLQNLMMEMVACREPPGPCACGLLPWLVEGVFVRGLAS